MEIELDINKKETTNKWVKHKVEEGPIPAERSKHISVLYKNFIYIFGGSQKIDAFGDLWKYDLDKHKWTLVSESNVVYFHSAVVYKDSLFVFGGYDSEHNKNSVMEFNFVSESWRLIPTHGTPPKERSGHASCVYKGSLYVFGGYDGSVRLNDMWKLDLETMAWTEIQAKGDKPSPRMNFGASVCGHHWYVFAGHSGTSTANDLFRFNLETNEWSIVEAEGAPERRFGHSLVTYQNMLYLFGGTSKDLLSSELCFFDPLQKRWSPIRAGGDMPSGRCYHSAVVSEEHGSLFIFGGSIVSGSKAFSNELFQFTFGTIFPPSSIANDLRAVLEQKLLPDCQLIPSDGGALVAHRALLSARCGWFSLQFLSAMSKKKAKDNKQDDETAMLKVEVDCKAAVLEALLHYLYTDEVVLDSLAEETLFLLLVAAHRFELERLQAFVDNAICLRLNLQNVITTLLWAVKEGWDHVKEFTFSYIVKNYSEIVLLEQFPTLGSELLVQIMRRQHKEAASSPKPFPLVSIPPPTLIEDLVTLYRDMDYSDFAFLVQGQEILAHKFMLAARTEFFRGLFTTGMKELDSKTMDVVIGGDIIPTPDAFNSFLNFVYTESTKISIENSIYLLPMCDFYGLKSPVLKMKCVDNIEHNLAPENLCQALVAADEIHSPELKQQILREITKDFQEVALPGENLQLLTKNLLIEVIQALARSKK